MAYRAGIFGALLAFTIATLASFNYIPIPDWIQQRLPSAQQAPLASLASTLDSEGCEQPNYKTRILSNDPLIMHVENFFTKNEMAHLIKIAEPLYIDSLTSAASGLERSKDRTSSSAYLPTDDPITYCISRRASAFQGFIPLENIEALQITSYKKGQQYVNHYDWGLPPDMFNGRTTTFFGILAQNCTNCGTAFPEVKFPWPDSETRVCDKVECTSDHLVAKPIVGSAVFWRNLHPDGTGHLKTLHAGLPVQEGFKVGLNIWSREWPVWTYDHPDHPDNAQTKWKREQEAAKEAGRADPVGA